MHKYIAKRLLLFIPALLGASIVIFALAHVVPGDPILAMLGDQSTVSFEQIDEMRRDYGLDQPLYIQYAKWLGGVARLDFGKSMWNQEPIGPQIANRFPLTLELTLLALFFSLLLAVPAGVISAARQDTWLDYALRLFAIGGLAMPTFWTGTLIIFFLVLWFQWMPPLGVVSLFDDPFTNLQQLFWPAIALGYALTSVVTRMTRSCMLEVLREDYIRTARAKGLKERIVVYRHALRNALPPVITISGIQFGRLLGGTVIVETIFSLPGMGRNLVDSVAHRDYPMIQAAVLLIALTFLFVNLAVDLVYGWLDPRIRYE